MRSLLQRLSLAAAVFTVGLLYPALAHADGLGPDGYRFLGWLALIVFVLIVLVVVGLISLLVWSVLRQRGRR